MLQKQSQATGVCETALTSTTQNFYTNHFNFMVCEMMTVIFGRAVKVCLVYLIGVSTKRSKVIHTEKPFALLNFCSADSFLAVADHRPLEREPVPAPLSPHISSRMQNK